MKAKFTLIVLAVLLQIVSCKKDEDPTITLNTKEVTLQHDITSQLTATPNQSCTWSSLDTNIATVSQTGLVTGVRIGDSKIIVTRTGSSLSDECTIHVTARSFLYKEPYYIYGKTINYVTSLETRALLSETSTGLVYSGENVNVNYVLYMFEHNALTSSDVMLAITTSVAELKIFLEERYIYLGYTSGVAFYKDGKGTLLGLSVDDTLGLNVLYYKDNGMKNNCIDFNEYLRFCKIFHSIKQTDSNF